MNSLMEHIFFLIGITVLWFLPGFFLRGIKEKKDRAAKEEAQAQAIARLYPAKKD